MNIFSTFLSNSELWPTDVGATCSLKLSDMGGGKIIWSPPSSNGLVIGALIASRGRKKCFFRTPRWWNNHLKILFFRMNWDSRHFSVLVSFWDTFQFQVTLNDFYGLYDNIKGIRKVALDGSFPAQIEGSFIFYWQKFYHPPLCSWFWITLL